MYIDILPECTQKGMGGGGLSDMIRFIQTANSLIRLLEKHDALQLPLSVFFSATFFRNIREFRAK